MRLREFLTRKRPPSQLVAILGIIFIAAVVITANFDRDPTVVGFTALGFGIPIGIICFTTILAVFIETWRLWRKMHRR